MSPRLLLLCLFAALLTAGDSVGIRPRGTASDYPAHGTAGGVTIAAAIVPPGQVSKLFSTDLNKAGYIVVEVAVYPETGNEANVQSRDFLMRLGDGSETLRPTTADMVASRIQQKNAPPPPKLPGNVSVITTNTIGYESGGYDPVTGQRRPGGVYTGTGVGVGVGQPQPPPRPGSTDQDRDAMERELADKGLPQVKTVDAIAGYLYFPKPSSSRDKNGPYHITYYGEHSPIRLTVPQPKK